MKFKSIKFKISLFFTAVLGVILLLYTAISYYNLRRALYRDLDNDIVVKAQEVSNAINAYIDALGNNQRAFDFAVSRVIRLEGSHPNQERIAQAEYLWLGKRNTLGLAEYYISLANIGRKEEIVHSVNMNEKMASYFQKEVAIPREKAVSYKDIDFDNYRLRMVTIPFYYKSKQMYLIQLGASRKPVFKILYGTLIFSSLAIPVVLLLASFLGGVITNRILKPVMEVTDTARNITHQDLSVRVKASQTDEELQYLVSAFNEMIARLDKSFRYIAEFSSNVAHELKTPLTILKGESELALMQPRDTEEYQRALKVNLDETEGMLRIVEDLLLLSKLEYQPQAFNFEQVDFSEFIKDIFEQAKRIASRKNVSVGLTHTDKPVFIEADRLHLRRMFLNLLHNAIKFTPPGGSVSLSLHADARKLKVSVSDTGIGIEPQHLEKIFDRFFHVDQKNQGAESGSGLGLSIAQSIAKIHRGHISVESQPRTGSTFTVTLPL
jgi:heavy metal sensor kinase